jgi:hypothetical protein
VIAAACRALLSASACLLAACAATGRPVSVTPTNSRPDCAPIQPLRDVPSQWLHLPIDWVDVWSGAYHDAQTGALVLYEIAGADNRGARLAREGDEVETGTSEGIPYVIRRGEDARGRYEALYSDVLNGPEAELAASMRRLLPPSGTSMLVATFMFGASEEWVFESAMSDERQRQRVTELFLRSRLKSGPDPCDDAPRRKAGISQSASDAVPVGAQASEVLAALGIPDFVRRASHSGFTMTYYLYSEERFVGYVELTFDRSQRLVDKSRLD